jgi:hypothetical protein
MAEHAAEDDRQEESLSELAPEPAVVTRVGNFALGAVMFTFAGAGVFMLIAGSMSRCMGATRSVKLEWEKRQQEIERAERECEAGKSATNTVSESKVRDLSGNGEAILH